MSHCGHFNFSYFQFHFLVVCLYKHFEFYGACTQHTDTLTPLLGAGLGILFFKVGGGKEREEERPEKGKS